MFFYMKNICEIWRFLIPNDLSKNNTEHIIASLRKASLLQLSFMHVLLIFAYYV